MEAMWPFPHQHTLRTTPISLIGTLETLHSTMMNTAASCAIWCSVQYVNKCLIGQLRDVVVPQSTLSRSTSPHPAEPPPHRLPSSRKPPSDITQIPAQRQHPASNITMLLKGEEKQNACHILTERTDEDMLRLSPS